MSMFPIKSRVTKLKRKPKRLDIIIPLGSRMSLEEIPLGIFYVQTTDGSYVKVESKIKYG